MLWEATFFAQNDILLRSFVIYRNMSSLLSQKRGFGANGATYLEDISDTPNGYQNRAAI